MKYFNLLWRLAFIFGPLLLVTFTLFPMASGQDKPGVTVNQDFLCGVQLHDHPDEDLRVRRTAFISKVDECGFILISNSEIRRLETNKETRYVELIDLTSLKIEDRTRACLRPKRVAMVWFCTKCWVAIAIQFRKEQL